MIDINKPKESYIQIKNIKHRFSWKKQIKYTIIDVELYPLTSTTVRIIGDFVFSQSKGYCWDLS
jgi:hypothetical protein